MKSKFLFELVLVIALVLQAGSINAQEKTEKQQIEGRTSLNVMSDSPDGSGETLINYSEYGHRYKIRLSGSKIIEMFVDETKIAEQDYTKYDSLVKKLLAQIEKDRKQAEEDRKQAAKDRQQAGKDREQANEDRKQAEKDRERAEQDRQQAEKNRQQADEDRERAEQDREQAGKDREQAEKDRQQAQIDRKTAEEDRKLFNEMMDEIVKEKLVENKEALKSLVLDENEFTVNGIKQSGNLHSKFKAKYLKTSSSRINYRNAGQFRRITVD